MPPKLHWPAFTRSWLLVILSVCPFWLFFLAKHTGCSILVLQPGIKHRTPAVKAWCPNHWTAREFSILSLSNTEEVKFHQLLAWYRSYLELSSYQWSTVVRDFPRCSVVKISCFQHREAWIWSLVGELRFHNLCDVAKKKKKKKWPDQDFVFFLYADTNSKQ